MLNFILRYCVRGDGPFYVADRAYPKDRPHKTFDDRSVIEKLVNKLNKWANFPEDDGDELVSDDSDLIIADD